MERRWAWRWPLRPQFQWLCLSCQYTRPYSHWSCRLSCRRSDRLAWAFSWWLARPFNRHHQSHRHCPLRHCSDTSRSFVAPRKLAWCSGLRLFVWRRMAWRQSHYGKAGCGCSTCAFEVASALSLRAESHLGVKVSGSVSGEFAGRKIYPFTLPSQVVQFEELAWSRFYHPEPSQQGQCLGYKLRWLLFWPIVEGGSRYFLPCRSGRRRASIRQATR